MAEKIVNDVIDNLQGEYGIRRYLGDSYWAPDYKEKLPQDRLTNSFIGEQLTQRNTLVTIGEEAQWCIFDPILSCIFGKMYQETGEHGYLEKQTHYFNRSLGKLTGSDSRFGELKCPESYYLCKGRYIESDSTPLLWTQANLLLAFKFMKQSINTNT